MTGLYVFVGGGLGSVLRWAVGLALTSPWGTLAVNLVGSALLAFLAHPAIGLSEPWKSALCVGALGGFTTYSTFNLEVLKALSDGRTAHAMSLIALTGLGALLAAAGGWSLAARFAG